MFENLRLIITTSGIFLKFLKYVNLINTLVLYQIIYGSNVQTAIVLIEELFHYNF